jgi:hypothetical protein
LLSKLFEILKNSGDIVELMDVKNPLENEVLLSREAANEYPRENQLLSSREAAKDSSQG